MKKLIEFVRKVLSEGLPEWTETALRSRVSPFGKYLLLVALVVAAAIMTFVTFRLSNSQGPTWYAPEMSVKEMLKKAKPKKGDFLIGLRDIIRTSALEPLQYPPNYPDVNQSILYHVEQLKQPLRLTFGQVPPTYPFCIEMVVDGTRTYPHPGVIPEFVKKNEKLQAKYADLLTGEDLDKINGSGASFACQAGFHDFDGDGFPEIVVCLGFGEIKDQKLWVYRALGPTSLQVWKYHLPANKHSLDRKENWQLLLNEPFQTVVWVHGRQITTPIGSRDGWRYTLVGGKFVRTSLWKDQNGNYSAYK